MPDRDEHDQLSEIAQQIAADDPQLAALLRDGPGRDRRAWILRLGIIATIALGAAALLIMKRPAAALAMATVAGCLWWLRRWRIIVAP
jgi:hypothetical protein